MRAFACYSCGYWWLSIAHCSLRVSSHGTVALVYKIDLTFQIVDSIGWVLQKSNFERSSIMMTTERRFLCQFSCSDCSTSEVSGCSAWCRGSCVAEGSVIVMVWEDGERANECFIGVSETDRFEEEHISRCFEVKKDLMNFFSE